MNAAPGSKTTNSAQIAEEENISKKIYRKGNDSRNGFSDLSIDKLCHTFEGQQSSAATINTQPMPGIIDNLQQAVQNLHTWRENMAENQC
jgi:hypothetical protein